MADAIEVTIDEVVIDDPATLQLRLRAERGGTANLVSTVWMKDEASALPGSEDQVAHLTLHSAMQERGDDDELAAAAERASVTAIDVEGQLLSMRVDGVPEFRYASPDAQVVYLDSDGRSHEV